MKNYTFDFYLTQLHLQELVIFCKFGTLHASLIAVRVSTEPGCISVSIGDIVFKVFELFVPYIDG
jgi:hypothetical protein